MNEASTDSFLRTGWCSCLFPTPLGTELTEDLFGKAFFSTNERSPELPLFGNRSKFLEVRLMEKVPGLERQAGDRPHGCFVL